MEVQQITVLPVVFEIFFAICWSPALHYFLEALAIFVPNTIFNTYKRRYKYNILLKECSLKKDYFISTNATRNKFVLVNTYLFLYIFRVVSKKNFYLLSNVHLPERVTYITLSSITWHCLSLLFLYTLESSLNVDSS